MSKLEPTRTYSNPTATDVLRRMLDERGVEHYDGTERTLWGYEQTGEDTGIYRFAASEISGGFLQFDMFRITPEQAIAATLGRGDVQTSDGQHRPVHHVGLRPLRASTRYVRKLLRWLWKENRAMSMTQLTDLMQSVAIIILAFALMTRR